MKLTASQSWLLIQISEVMNDPTISWKVQRALLRHQFCLDEDFIKKLIPEPAIEDSDEEMK